MLIVHVLDVGKGSCAVLDFQDSRQLTMIDIDNSRAEKTDPVAFLQTRFPGRSLFRFILTHPDLDHMSGLNALAHAVSITNFWDTDNKKQITDWTGSPYRREDWECYQRLRSSQKNPACLLLHQGARAECCWLQDGINILAPTRRLVQLANERQEYNHLSYVLLVEHQGVRILFGGDATVETWEEISQTWPLDDLRADIFVAPHHGSAESIHKEVFRHIAPDWVVVSTARGIDYAYNYYQGLASRGVLSTKHRGSITITIPGRGLPYSIRVEKGA